jgi:hypothetical protein
MALVQQIHVTHKQHKPYGFLGKYVRFHEQQHVCSSYQHHSTNKANDSIAFHIFIENSSLIEKQTARHIAGHDQTTKQYQ